MSAVAIQKSASVSVPALLVKLESAAVFLGAVFAYSRLGGDWPPFVLLILVPDLAMIGYLANAHLGSITYNAVHTYIVPAAFLALSLAANFGPGAQIALIWIAHIGADRVLGFGLKYAAAFKETHLQRI